MEPIIVTFINNGKETDVRLPNHIEGQKLVPGLIEWSGSEYDWGHGVHDLEFSFDQKHWFRLDKFQTLESAGIWDGAFIRLSEEPSSSLPTFQEAEVLSADEEDVRDTDDLEESQGYVWKILD